MRTEEPLIWQKSSASSAGNNCIELALSPGHGIYLRESEDPSTVIATTPSRLHGFLAIARTHPVPPQT